VDAVSRCCSRFEEGGFPEIATGMTLTCVSLDRTGLLLRACLRLCDVVFRWVEGWRERRVRSREWLRVVTKLKCWWECCGSSVVCAQSCNRRRGGRSGGVEFAEERFRRATLERYRL
jgi:hypothetical protein